MKPWKLNHSNLSLFVPSYMITSATDRLVNGEKLTMPDWTIKANKKRTHFVVRKTKGS